MAADVSKMVIVDGPRIAVVQFVVSGNIVGPNDLTNKLILDTKNDIYPLGTPTRSTVTRIWWNFNGFDGYISKQDTVPVPIWALNQGSGNKVDFRSFGGINVPVDLDGNGDIMLTTLGLSGYTVGTLIIELKKD